MSVSLQKGGNVHLEKPGGGDVTEVAVGLGWDERTTSGAAFDLDASAFTVGGDDKVLDDAWFVFYGNLTSPDGNVQHTGDNLTGSGSGDDEVINVNLDKLPPTAERVVFSVTIYEADQRGQNFGMVKNAFIRVVDKATGTELARYDLGEDYSVETAMIFGELYRNGAGWKFRAVGQGYHDGLAGLCRDHGVNIA